MADVGNFLIAIKADVDDFHMSMATAREALTNFGGKTIAIGRAVRRTGLMITAGAAIASAAMAGLANSAVKVEREYNQVQTLISQNKDAMEEYQDTVRRLTTEFGVQGGEIETTQALYQTLSASIDDTKEETEDFLETTMRVARVGNTQMRDSVTLLATAVNAYGEEASWAEEASDIMFKTVDSGMVTFEELAQTLGPVIAFAAELEVQLEELSAGMAVLTRQGFSARRASFALRSILQQFMRPGEEFRQILQDIAIQKGLLGEEAEKLVEQIETEQDELNELQGDIADVANEIRDLQDEYGLLTSDIRENRIEIEEIRLQARRSGRDLTRAEERQIERLQTANSELRLEQMNIRQEMDERQRTQEQLERSSDSLEESIEENKEGLEAQTGAIGETVLEHMTLNEALLATQEAANDMNTTIGQVIPNQRALQGIFPIIANDAREFAGDLEEMENAGGTVERRWENMAQSADINLAQAMQNLKSIFRATGQILIDELLPFIERLGDKFERAKDFVEGLDESTRSAIARFALLVTGIGLLLGPLLILAGQLAVIIGAAGLSGLIQILGGAAVAVGGLSEAFRRMTSDTEQAEQTIDNIRGVFERLREVASTLRAVFFDDLAPAMLELAIGFGQWISAARDGLSGLRDDLGLSETSIRDVSQAISDIIETIGLWMQDNSDAIEGITSLAATVAGNLIPALVELGSAISDVVLNLFQIMFNLFTSDEASRTLNVLSNVIEKLSEALSDQIQWLANYINENEKFVTSVLAGATAMAAVLLTIKSVVAAGSSLVGVGVAIKAVGATILGIVGLLSAPIIAIGLLVAAIVLIGLHFPEETAKAWEAIKWFIERAVVGFKFIGGVLKDFVVSVIDGVKAIIKFLNLLTGVYGAVTTKIGQFIAEAIQAVGKWVTETHEDISKWMQNVGETMSEWRENMIQTVNDAIDTVKAIFIGWNKFLSNFWRDLISDGLNWGQNLIDSFTDGIERGMDRLERAVENAAERVSDYLGIFSDAKTGPLSTLTQWGGNLVSTISDGIRNSIGMIDDALGLIPGMDSPLSFTADATGVDGVKESKTIFTIEEGAIKFMPGAFQGISDEEIPEKVREEIEDAFMELKRDLEGKGRGTK